jgi:hypothetical protein
MASMLSLLDVLPRHERVDIGGDVNIDVFGISAEDIGAILARYPDAFQQLANAQQPGGLNPKLFGALVGASQRNGKEESLLGNETVERRGRSLGVGAQMKILKAIGRCTFPDGIGPFLEDLKLLSSSAKEAVEVVIQAQPDSKAQATRSPPPPRPSGPPNIPASGSSRRAK